MSSTDYDQIRTDAAATVAHELAQVTDPFARRIRAEEIRDQAYMELAALKPERDQLIAAAALYEPSDNLHLRFGITYNQMKRIASAAIGTMKDPHTPPPWPADRTKAAHKAGLPHTPDTVAKAVKIATRYESAEARRDAALVCLEAAHEAVRTAGGRTKVEAVARPDFTEIRRKAAEEIRAEFAKLAVAPEQRLRLAADAVDQAEDETAALLPERNQALATLAFYTTASALYYSAGLTRQGMVRVLESALGLPRGSKLPARAEQPAAARAAKVKFLKNAGEELPQIAAAYEATKARHGAAIEIRDAAIRVLHAEPYGWTQTRLAEFIDRDVAVVNRVVNAAPAQGRKKSGREA